jgi:hypothetical protein
VGWINYLPQETNLDEWADIINKWIAVNFTEKDDASNKKHILIGLELKGVHDGLGSEAKKRLTDKERWAKRAVHVVCKKGDRVLVQSLIRAFLQSKKFRYLCHFPSRLIPPLPRGYAPVMAVKYQEATQKHMKLVLFGTGSHTTFAFNGPDKPCSFGAGENRKSTTIRSRILSIKARGKNHPLFLAVNAASKPTERGGYVITYPKQYEAEAVEKIDNLSAYLQHHFGEESLERFTQEACDLADLTKWDKENDRPITLQEQELDAMMGDDIEWAENLDDVTFGNKPEVEIVLERPKIDSSRFTPLPASADDDTIGTFFPGQAVPNPNEMEDDMSIDTGQTDPTYRAARDESRAAHPTSEASDTAEASPEASADGIQ